MKRFFVVMIGIVAISGLVIQARAQGKGAAQRTMQKRRVELRANLLRERVRILKEDAQAATISRQIQALYRDLDQIIEDKQSIKQIRRDIREVDKLLSAKGMAKGE